MKLTTRKIVIRNFWGKPFRSIGLAILIAVTSAVLLVGGLFTLSVDSGLDQLSSRMGADVLIVPRGSDIKSQSVLLQGDLSHNVMPRDVLDAVRKIPGVREASPQFYFTTLGAACCDKKVNIIGFDSKTDFTIKPWIRRTYKKDFPVGSVIVGSDIHVGDSGKIKFFDKEFTVVASLEPLGSKLDQAVFADAETVALIREAAEAKGFRYNSDGEVSAVLVNLDKDADFELLKRTLRTSFDDLQIIARKDLFSSVVATVSFLKKSVVAIITFFFLVAIAAVYIAFSISANERKKEFATLRVVGATRKKLKHIVLGESLLVSGSGAITGALFSALVFFGFRILIADILEIPFLLPETATIILVFFAAVLLPIAAGIVSTYQVARRVGNLDVYSALKEDI